MVPSAGRGPGRPGGKARPRAITVCGRPVCHAGGDGRRSQGWAGESGSDHISVVRPADVRAHGAQARGVDTGPRVRPDQVDQRGRAVGRGARGPGLGERGRVVLRDGLADRAVSTLRPLGPHPEPAWLGEQRADDVLLPGGRVGGTSRVRHGRVARPTAAGPAAARRTLRVGHAGRHLPRGERRSPVRTRLGHRDVDGHRIRAGHAGPGRAAAPAAPPHVHPHRAGGRRPGLARRHRHRLQRTPHGGRAAGRDRTVRCGPAGAFRGCSPRRRLRTAGRGDVGRAVRVRGRTVGRRPGHGPVDLRLPGRAGRRGPAWARRSHRTTGSSRSTTRGPAT